MKFKFSILLIGLLLSFHAKSISLIIPMDDSQKNHLKAYGIAFWVLENDIEVKWLLNYRGGSFLINHSSQIENECMVRGVTSESITDAQAAAILDRIAQPDVNQDAVAMNKAPKIAVYSPSNKQPWDDAVTMVLTYAEINYDIIYDEEIINGELTDYDWLHLHHEDFTGQFGKFWRVYQNAPWYQQDVAINRALAKNLGFLKVSEMKSFVTREI